MEKSMEKSSEKEGLKIGYPNNSVFFKSNEEAWNYFKFNSAGGKKKKMFKISETPVPFAKGLVLCDVKLARKGNEDTLFERNPKLLYNMRRGVSFLMTEKIYTGSDTAGEVAVAEEEKKKEPKKASSKKKENKKKAQKKEEKQFEPPSQTKAEVETAKATDQKESKSEPPIIPTVETKTIGEIPKADTLILHPTEKKVVPLSPIHVSRKGLQKFFDVYKKFFDPAFTIPNKDNLANYLLYPVQEHLLNKGKIELYATRKANGENAQISYLSAFGLWSIASKNVSLLARNADDLKCYNEDNRYWFALEIGRAWFRLLSKIEAAGKITEFKSDIGNKTMVGEYVGNPKHQHLVSYCKETIMFYAIVDNEGITNCADSSWALSIFDKYGLDRVTFESRGIYGTLDEIKKALALDYDKVAVESLENEEEGIVIYLVARGLERDYTLSLCKIKTLEYRIYRKIRESIKNKLRQSLTTAKSMATLRSGCSNLLKSILGEESKFNVLPMPYEYYFRVAETAFDIAERLNAGENKFDVSSTFVDFIEECMSICNTDIILNFLKSETTKVILFITPPYYLPEDVIAELDKKWNYLTFYDIIDKPLTEDSKKITILHLYSPPLPRDKKPGDIAILSKHLICFDGCKRDYLPFSEYLSLFEKKRLCTSDIDKLCKRDRNLIRSQPYQIESMYEKAKNNLKKFLLMSDEKKIPIKFFDCNPTNVLSKLLSAVSESK